MLCFSAKLFRRSSEHLAVMQMKWWSKMYMCICCYLSLGFHLSFGAIDLSNLESVGVCLVSNDRHFPRQTAAAANKLTRTPMELKRQTGWLSNSCTLIAKSDLHPANGLDRLCDVRVADRRSEASRVFVPFQDLRWIYASVSLSLMEEIRLLSTLNFGVYFTEIIFFNAV